MADVRFPPTSIDENRKLFDYAKLVYFHTFSTSHLAPGQWLWAMQEKFGVNCGARKKLLVSIILALTLTLGRNIEPISSSRVRRCAAVPSAE